MIHSATSGEAQERRLAAIAAASATAFRHHAYQQVRAEDVAELVRLSRKGEKGKARSAVWLYNEVRSRRVLVALALKHAFEEFADDDPGPAESPETVADAQSLIAATLVRIAAFSKAERFLVGQVRLGIGDISTSEKRSTSPQNSPEWPDGPYGEVAASGWEGRVTAYAQYLAPRIETAVSTVAVPPAGWARGSAERLSELAFRALSDDAEGATERQADALAAYWFERDVVTLAGGWANALRTTERAAALALHDGAGPRIRMAALEQVLRILIDGTPLTARAIQVAAELAQLLEALAGDGRSVDDLRLLCDIESRRGLLLLRLGDPAGAVARLERSREVAAQLPDEQEAESYMARVDHNIADALIAMDRPAEAALLLGKVAATRAKGVSREGVSPRWRRLTLTRQAAVRAATRSGRVIRGVLLAEEVLRDRVQRLGAGNVNTASARITLAEALLAAGDPIHARRHLLEAMSCRAQYLPSDGYWRQYDNVRLAEIELAAGFPALAISTLTGSAVSTPWFKQRVSERLAQEAAILHAEALTADGAAGAALDLLGRFSPGDRGASRARAEALLSLGRADEAAAVLESLTEIERGLGDDSPGLARTLLLATRAADARGRADESEAFSAALEAMAGPALDAQHPAVLAGRMATATRRAQAGLADEVPALLAPLLSRTPLEHARPALAEGHPLLAEARALAARLGTSVPAGAPEQLWEDL
ncbi:hypothetical protein B0I32_105425 [Nonomuraea fuscirosea]|uniref:Tetratricopeptide repeat protein n=1 Tax=Nonomuraea fuscirosea TaxID=1291556 RepID=A0A2T0N496_9ACTN|nr:hypothetical protein [Nonomuraea fuscirosea]PRX66985.1 hypothetical protein B0I32_105425 [Nonomuraea fuscirosea]